MAGPVQVKTAAFIGRLTDLIRQWPERLYRLGRHLRRGIDGWIAARRRSAGHWKILAEHGRWWLEWFLLILDLAGLPEWYESVADWIKFRSRPLTPEEEAFLRPVFGAGIPYRRIRIDERAYLGPRQWRMCYVSFAHINNWGPVDPVLLVHEVVHVWQFWQVGSPYIPRALSAQYSPDGYNYGGARALYRAREQGRTLSSFNYEQQADIITDFFRLTQGMNPYWGSASAVDLPVYQHFADQLRREISG